MRVWLELVDAADLESVGRKLVEVRLLSFAPRGGQLHKRLFAPNSPSGEGIHHIVDPSLHGSVEQLDAHLAVNQTL